MKKIYLAAPYSHWCFLVRIWRVRKVNKYAAKLMDQGHIVFSPVSHSHPISKYTKADSCDSNFWIKQDLAFIPIIDELWIYKLPGWLLSGGIRKEIVEAERLGKVIKWIDHTKIF